MRSFLNRAEKKDWANEVEDAHLSGTGDDGAMKPRTITAADEKLLCQLIPTKQSFKRSGKDDHFAHAMRLMYKHLWLSTGPTCICNHDINGKCWQKRLLFLRGRQRASASVHVSE